MQKKYLRIKELCTYLSFSPTKARRFAKSIGAEIKVGGCCLYDLDIIDNHLKSLVAKTTKKDNEA